LQDFDARGKLPRIALRSILGYHRPSLWDYWFVLEREIDFVKRHLANFMLECLTYERATYAT